MPTPKQATRCMVEIVAVAGGLRFRKTLPAPAQQTLGWAVNASGLYALAPQLKEAKVGVWGKIFPATTVVAEGDRIEVYSPVLPEALQAHRANLQRVKKSGKVAGNE